MSKASDGLPTKAKTIKKTETPAKPAPAAPVKAAAEKPSAKTATAVKPASVPPAAAAPAAVKPTATAKPKAPAKTTVSPKAKVAAKPTAAAKAEPAATRKVSQLPDQDTINKMVEEAAYYLAEKRNFAPGFEEQDWLDAKQQIMDQLEGASPPKA